ncbi:MAG: hypothetical protein U0T82_16385 [Bacteroidales bacterium]
MKRVILFSFFLFTVFNVFSQDVIYLNSGSRIYCRVTSADSSRVYYNFDVNGVERSSSIDQRLVKEIKYKPVMYQNETKNEPKNESKYEAPTDYRQCITVGILQGGGSLVGADLELKLSDRFGIQAGMGFIGFGAGLNLHFKPTLRSSYLSLQYWHQGYEETYTQSLFGPSVVLRGKRWLSAQIGMGALLESGPAWPKDKEHPSVMLTYALGFYIPW